MLKQRKRGQKSILDDPALRTKLILMYSDPNVSMAEMERVLGRKKSVIYTAIRAIRAEAEGANEAA